MENYTIIQSKEEINYSYSRLIDKLNEHVSLLSKEGIPFASVMGMVRGLRRLKLDYLDKQTESGQSVSEEELILADKVQAKLGVDILPAVQLGLIGIRQMKNALVLHEYEMMAKKGLKYKEIKSNLSKEYGISVSAIEKLVYRKKG